MPGADRVGARWTPPACRGNEGKKYKNDRVRSYFAYHLNAPYTYTNMPSLFSLPNELVLEIVLKLAGDEAFSQLRATRQTCSLLASLSIPVMFRSLTLGADAGHQPMTRHIQFFEKAEYAAGHVEEMRIIGAVDEGGDEFGYSVMGADEITRVANVLPALVSMTVRDALWTTRRGKLPPSPSLSLTRLNLQEITLVTPGPFPANVLQQLPNIKVAKLSFAAAWSPLEREFNEAITTGPEGVRALEFAASVPFLADTIQATIQADEDTLEDLTIELTPLGCGPFWLGRPEPLSIERARILRRFHFILPMEAFPAGNYSNCTWTYANSVLSTVPPATGLLELVLECSGMTDTQVLPRLAFLPLRGLRSAIDRMSSTSEVRITLRTGPGEAHISWPAILEACPQWKYIAESERVNLRSVEGAKEGGPFAPFLPKTGTDEEDEDDDLMLLWNPEA